MTARTAMTHIDFDGDRKQWSVPTANITAANHDTHIAAVTALREATEDITGTTVIDYAVLAREVKDIVSQPTNAIYQTKTQWLCTYHYSADASEVRHVSIPCADLSGAWAILSGGETILDLASTEGAAFKTAFETLVTTDDGSATVVLDKVEFRE